jgi:predicted RecB family endonuclease
MKQKDYDMSDILEERVEVLTEALYRLVEESTQLVTVLSKNPNNVMKYLAITKSIAATRSALKTLKETTT